MGSTSLLIQSSHSKKESTLDRLERDYHQARLELDEKRNLLEKKQQQFTQLLEEEYAMAASFLQKQELDVECEWRALNHCIELYDLEAREASQDCLRQIEAEEESLWQSYQKERRQLEEKIERETDQ